MNTKIIYGIMISLLILMLAGCSAPTCYPPNKILGNKCCIDADNNEICDYEEQKETEPTEEVPVETESTEETTEPTIQKVTVTQPTVPAHTGVVLGKQKMTLGESKKYLTIDDMSAFRISRDKGMMDYMVITVRNIGETPFTPVVELLFEGARIEEYQVRVKKEYVLEQIKPGEKLVLNQSLGIKFGDINSSKEMTLSIFDKFSAPRDDFEVLKKQFNPTDYMDSMEIFTHGLPETD